MLCKKCGMPAGGVSKCVYCNVDLEGNVVETNYKDISTSVNGASNPNQTQPKVVAKNNELVATPKDTKPKVSNNSSSTVVAQGINSSKSLTSKTNNETASDLELTIEMKWNVSNYIGWKFVATTFLGILGYVLVCFIHPYRYRYKSLTIRQKEYCSSGLNILFQILTFLNLVLRVVLWIFLISLFIKFL